MTSEIQLFSGDRIRLNILREVLNGAVSLSLQMGSAPAQDYAKEIHEDGKRVYVYGKFNISEDVNGGETLTVRPVAGGTPLTISFLAGGEITDKKLSIVRGVSKQIEKEYEITVETQSIEFVPQESSGYLLKITSDAELLEINREISAIRSQQEQLNKKKQGAKKHLETIEAEYKKDQASYQKELDELKSRAQVDESIVAYYSDRDITPTKDILKEARQKLEEAEAQIRLFVEARQLRTMEIESEIKSGKRQ